MDLEFDKEIDALLRKVRPAAGKTAVGEHLDADAVAAFAEGAIPEAARGTYMRHLADCDRCRESLAFVAHTAAPASQKATAAAAAASPSPWPPNALPWYRRLFSTPGLAAAFGVLVLGFGGVLVYLAVQRGSNSEASMTAANTSKNAVPYAGVESSAANANANASMMSNAAVTNTAAANATASSQANSSAAAPTANSSSNSVASLPLNGRRTSPVDQPAMSVDGTSTDSTGGAPPESRPVAAAPPAPAGAERPATSETTSRARDEERKDDERSSTATEDRAARNNPAALAKKSVGGPLRSAGPVQGQMQSNAQSYEMPVTRKVGGKTFRNSSGAWYDLSYSGQSTVNVHRGSDEFKKLDAGLRSIANELNGVVVVVWKSTAYRIQ